MAKHEDQAKDESMTTAEAGRMGGEKTRERGSAFYSEIGSQQGKENNPGNFANRPKEEVKAAGSAGGHAGGQQMHDQADEDNDQKEAA